MSWRKSVTIQVGQKHYSGMLHDPALLISCKYNSPAVFITQLTFFCFPILLDSIGPVSLLHVFGWQELPWCFRLPTGSLDTETFHRSCRQLWLDSLWLRHQELHRQENSRVRDASSSHEGRGLIHSYTHTLKSCLQAFMEIYPLIWMNEVFNCQFSCLKPDHWQHKLI